MKTENLNPDQLAAVTSTAQLRVVIAGPGSGKTRTLVAAIARAAVKYGADGIIAITYTNAAAEEIEKRVAEQLPGYKLGFCGTLHAFLLRLLNSNGPLVNVQCPVSVLDDEQRESVLLSIAEEMGCKKLSKTKLLEALEDTAQYPADDKAHLVAREYRLQLQRSGLLDFEMILTKGLKLIEKLNQQKGGGFEWEALFVDEFQDAAAIDAQIYDALPCGLKMMVGDPDQAIYSFRGGDVNCLLELAKRCQDASEAQKRGDGMVASEYHAELFKLETNHRCLAAITSHANNLIGHNIKRLPKVTIPCHRGGLVDWEEYLSPAAEQVGVLIELMKENAATWHECAVLARTNPIANEFAEVLKAKGIPVAQKKWRENPPDWKKAKLLLTVMANPYNDLAAYQYLVLKDGKPCADRAKLDAAMKMKPLAKDCLSLGFDAHLGLSNSLCQQGLGSESRERIHDACRHLSNRGEWAINDLLVFLNLGEEQREEVGQGVTVTTIHSAKGREWKKVFIVGAEEGFLPMTRADSDIEEERRVMFVGMTRAAEYLHISCCRERPLPFGRHVMEQRAPSRFLREMSA